MLTFLRDYTYLIGHICRLGCLFHPFYPKAFELFPRRVRVTNIVSIIKIRTLCIHEPLIIYKQILLCLHFKFKE